MAAILESPDLAPLVARHLHDVVDAVGLCAPRMPRMPALLAVSRRVRAAALPAYAEDGYLTFRAAVLAYTLVPHAAEGAELPLAWRVTLTTPLFPAGTTAALVHPVGALWRRTRRLEYLHPLVPRMMAYDAHVALYYLHDGASGTSALRALLHLLGAVVDDGLVHVYLANILPWMPLQAALDRARAQ